jgi:hypothetical protein
VTVARLAACVVAAAALVVALGTAPASARRTATAAESRAMWRTVDAQSMCVHRRGFVSTVSSGRYRYGRVTIADSTCGNGVNVLRRPRAGGRWRTVLAGSDIGAPGRCTGDLKKIPRAVYRDLFPRDPNCP